MRHEVVISGIGIVSPLGQTREASFANAIAAKSAIRAAPAAITQWLPHALAASVDNAFLATLNKNETGLDRATQFALIAAREALLDADFVALDPNRTGVFSGIGLGGATTLDNLYSQFYERLAETAQAGRNPTVVHPLSVPRLMPNAAAAAISMAHGFRGTTNTYSVACASSSTALGEAYRHIQHGYADAIIVVGTEAMLTTGALVAWNALRVMAKPDVVDIAASCKPFAKDRSGFVLGEGAAVLVLESRAHAQQRQAKNIYAELCGYGTSSDAHHLTAPSVEGQARAMQAALDDADLPASAIAYINAHGTATEVGDVTETNSIRQVFGAHAERLAVSSTKSMHGHLIGAAGALEFALSLLAMRHKILPPTANLLEADPRCDLDYVAYAARPVAEINAVMSNSFAFGGSNVALIARQTCA